MNDNRQLWIDAVKGLTIIMVVFHHVFYGVQASLGLSDFIVDAYKLTNPIRMPLFFSVAGFFALKSINSPFSSFLEKKVYHFLYLYVLWSVISISIRAFLSDFTNNEVYLSDLFYIFWRPTFTIWFLYALLIAFLAARLTRNVNPHFQIFLALVCGSIAYAFPEFDNIFTRTIKLYPFFIAGVYFSKNIRFLVEQKTKVILLMTGISYFLLSMLVFKKWLEMNFFLYYSMAILGALFFMTFVRILSPENAIFRGLSFVGARSLHIYLMHFLPAAGFRVLLVKSGMSDPLYIIFLGTFFSVLSCIFVSAILTKYRFFKFLFSKPNI